MVKVAQVKLPYAAKTLWFDPSGVDCNEGDDVVVETTHGHELGVCTTDIIEIDEESIDALPSPLRRVLRCATTEDIDKARELDKKSEDAFQVFRELAHETCDEMHPISVNYLLDDNRAVFYFSAEHRVDFRELVKRLASALDVKVELYQVGSRDCARIIGGFGHCGQIVCCKRMRTMFKSVSIKMAKVQNLTLDSKKISGLCGRLMCCLDFELDCYKDFNAKAPKIGDRITTPKGEAHVIGLDMPHDQVRIQLDSEKPMDVKLDLIDKAQNGLPASIPEASWTELNRKSEVEISYGNLYSLSRFTVEDRLASPGTGENITEGINDKKPLKSFVIHPDDGADATKDATGIKQKKRSRGRRRVAGKTSGNPVAVSQKSSSKRSQDSRQYKKSRKSQTVSPKRRKAEKKTSAGVSEPASAISRVRRRTITIGGSEGEDRRQTDSKKPESGAALQARKPSSTTEAGGARLRPGYRSSSLSQHRRENH